MKNERRLLPLSLLLFVAVSSWEHAVHGVEFRRPAATGVGCNGSIAECHAEAEFLMDSETHRRFLGDGGHISYGALAPDRPACNSGGGQPYGKCLPARSLSVLAANTLRILWEEEKEVKGFRVDETSENDEGRMKTKSRSVSCDNETKRMSTLMPPVVPTATGKPLMLAPSSKPSAETLLRLPKIDGA
ncbi:hypothetical protein BHE74_00059599 [Ensete ventricosum]|nr:hypothetical protein GW17_00044421 [Ensete ventricosum]RWW35476.1 hypothetical protein BHE74_00059599 [Ensete ventricosum]RZS27182.1 hypothetical protein BHM03_00060615 [Ensete ventricosum]